ncbi:MAG: hypothetical protein K0S46_751 [Moraxellaceae bacterium]|nr:hypothetical protein [Moraxellaceae bacterium]
MLLACVVGLLPLPASAETRVLVTGEWPPYTGLHEPEGGSMAAIVRAAYAAQGDEVRIGFFSWYRIRRLPRDNGGITASFPHYNAEERATRCHFSNPIGSSPLGLALPLRSTLHWGRLEDLGRYRIGTVKSYSNTLAFDRLVAAGRIRTVQAVTDADNLRNLLAGKVDAAIIDRNVFAYLLRQDNFRGKAAQLRLDQRLLVVHNLYVCFPKNEKGLADRDHFNAGLGTLQEPSPAAL